MTRRTLHITIAALLLAGCAAMNQFSGLGVVSVQKSAIDGSAVVQVTGNHVMGLYGGMATFDGAMLGGRWESINPDTVNILVTYPSSINSELIIIEFDELRVNVNGSITSYKPVGPAQIAMPLSFLESMLVADVCKLQLIRGPLVTEGDFAIASNAGTPTAKVSLQRFYDKVRATKAELAAKQAMEARPRSFL